MTELERAGKIPEEKLEEVTGGCGKEDYNHVSPIDENMSCPFCGKVGMYRITELVNGELIPMHLCFEGCWHAFYRDSEGKLVDHGVIRG